MREAIVYGVTVPRHEGRAGMAALVTDPGFDPARFAAEVAAQLPRNVAAGVPASSRTPDLTASFKYVTTRFKQEGFPHTVAGSAVDRERRRHERLTPEVSIALAGAIRL